MAKKFTFGQGRAGLKILETNAQIEKEISRVITRQINESLVATSRFLYKEMYPILERYLRISPEILSLSEGLLQAEFGLDSDVTPLLITSIMGSFNVNVTKARGGSAARPGSIKLQFSRQSYEDLLVNEWAYQDVESYIDGSYQGSIPWLDWLLNYGDSIIIADYGVEIGDFGRTGLAHMVKKNAPYKVNSSYSGVATNNFITRSVFAASSELGKVFAQAQAKFIKGR
jgi:hypothetical protein|tara:strand:+ start:938 stop:1621 length:684 start_codon:yes stop_codon:yes gene_type:complete